MKTIEIPIGDNESPMKLAHAVAERLAHRCLATEGHLATLQLAVGLLSSSLGLLVNLGGYGVARSALKGAMEGLDDLDPPSATNDGSTH
jgi:hypothetical protein